MDMPAALKEIGETGQSFANDLDDVLDGKFGFTVTEQDGQSILTARFEPCVEDGTGPDGSDYGPPQEFVWHLVPVSGHAG